MQRFVLIAGTIGVLCSIPACVRERPPGIVIEREREKKDDPSPAKKPEPPASELPSLTLDRFQTLAAGLLTAQAYAVNKDGCVVGQTTFGKPESTTLFFWDPTRDYKAFLPQTDDRYEIDGGIPPSINDHNLVAFTARRKDKGTLHAFLWNVEEQFVY